GAGVGVEIQQELTAIELGKAEVVAEIKPACDEQITILAFGSRVMVAIEAAEQFAQKHDVGVRVVNMRFVKPLDEKIIRDLAEHTQLFVTV
ncbi:transketolase C-terminal domain-containing protein, partial [Pseudomonas putida]